MTDAEDTGKSPNEEESIAPPTAEPKELPTVALDDDTILKLAEAIGSAITLPEPRELFLNEAATIPIVEAIAEAMKSSISKGAAQAIPIAHATVFDSVRIGAYETEHIDLTTLKFERLQVQMEWANGALHVWWTNKESNSDRLVRKVLMIPPGNIRHMTPVETPPPISLEEISVDPITEAIPPKPADIEN